MKTTDSRLGMEAAQWLLELSEAEVDPETGFATIAARNEAFFGWLATSADCPRVFLETVATHRRMPLIDPQRLIEIEALINARTADVVRLHGGAGDKGVAEAPALHGRINFSAREPRRHGSHWAIGMAASAAALSITASLYWHALGADTYTTSIGEQRQAKLEDGTLVCLNTDSRVEIDFSAQVRNVRLVRGEALFVVEKDSRRPFIVSTGNATVRAVGTQFNVRDRSQATEVAVIEGMVQVAALDSGDEPVSTAAGNGTPAIVVPSKRLSAGEQVRVVKGEVVPQRSVAVTDALAWRQRRLVFHDARLADVAAEFNRYNRTRIRIEGDAAQIQLSGIFDADRPQALMLYAAKNEQLVVEPQGSDWVVRAR